MVLENNYSVCLLVSQNVQSSGGLSTFRKGRHDFPCQGLPVHLPEHSDERGPGDGLAAALSPHPRLQDGQVDQLCIVMVLHPQRLHRHAFVVLEEEDTKLVVNGSNLFDDVDTG